MPHADDLLPDEIQNLKERCETVFTPIADRRTVWRLWGSDGPVRVMLHGGSGSWMHWIRNIDALGKKYRLLVPDIPGTGDSDLPTRPFDRNNLVDSMAGIASDLHVGLTQILHDMNVREYAITGFSMGSIAGTYLAALDSHRCSQLVLVGTSALGISHGSLAGDLEGVDENDSRQEALDRQGRNLRIIMLGSDSAVDSLAKYIQLENIKKARIRTHWLSRSDALRQRIGDVKAPITTIWGENDVYAKPDIGARVDAIRELQPSVTSHVLQNAGHWAMYEQADAFNALHLNL